MSNEQLNTDERQTTPDELIEINLKLAYAALRNALVSLSLPEDDLCFEKLAMLGAQINLLRARNAELCTEQAKELATAYTEGGDDLAKVQGERDSLALREGVLMAVYFPENDPIIEELLLEGMNVLEPGEVAVRSPDSETEVAVFRMVSGVPSLDQERGPEVSESIRSGVNPRAHRTAGFNRPRLHGEEE